MNRAAGADLELGGRAIRQGESVLLGIAAANRDPAAFDDPDGFDVGRDRRPHLAFAAGTHACPGMGLARLELEVAMLALFRRFPGVRFDPDRPPRRRCETLFFRGFAALPVVTA
jgi:cytochrome P450 PksS